jgi:hypothetical protein
MAASISQAQSFYAPSNFRNVLPSAFGELGGRIHGVSSEAKSSTVALEILYHRSQEHKLQELGARHDRSKRSFEALLQTPAPAGGQSFPSFGTDSTAQAGVAPGTQASTRAGASDSAVSSRFWLGVLVAAEIAVVVLAIGFAFILI